MEITEEQIKEAHNAACSQWKQKIEEWFPECFKQKLEVGKWYKNGLSIINYQGGKDGYGYYGSEDIWIDLYDSLWNFDRSPKQWTPATTEEVESMLIKEAEKKGLVDGVILAKNGINNISSFNFEPIKGYHFFDEKNILDSGNANGHIFDNGKWATIVETPKEMTLEEIEKQLGHKVKIVS